MSKLLDSRVLVVGGSSGIGLAVATQASELGARVTIVSRSLEKLDAAASTIGNGVEIAALDTSDNGEVQKFFSARDSFDHVVVSAAQTPSGSLRILPLEDAKRAMESKFWGAYRIAKEARIKERGTLTFVSGFLSERPSATSVLQGAINAALEALARGLALEFSPVRVNTVSPGLINTPLWGKMDLAAKEAMFERVANNLPARTIGEPSDIANAVVFLMTTPFATGSTVRVDGGGVIA
ncbi:NAD(P)-dependent dehydrogenase (short-subunit alcohol dehydrogenase family) [Pararhizobium capsulatum DSM 1112]|uniref:NAD(P)-dependent dehydrogenase (Short-subunit alcohol dehydrogenase family) n=1 Tax=Pararhizobium capsulatum DSM 1112 TaxID=1121113 RepID=A0ABU0C0K5_9HYPH|nr:SDR family oxidoreductase [Pararhizobium capsulatum]MDQ0324044.1 NAD(P)-dependent dehydrogenase (short-subunit alcohol dehydrogenase family) [Pararhizobium capsulatum DSM 1112]